MDEDARQEEQSRAGRYRARLFGARWTLIAAAISGLVLLGVEQPSPILAVILFAIVAAVTAVAPRRTAGQRRADEAAAVMPAGVDQLPAADLAAAVPDPLFVFDARGTVVHANGAAAVSFGSVAQGMVLQMKFRAPEMQELLRRVLENGMSGAIDYAERVPVERVFRVVAAPLGSDRGLFVLIFRDQSEARRIDRMRADFIANASHELRTPLASISGFIETLRGPARNDPKARENFLQIMQNQTSRMARLIDDLLSLSRLEMKPYLSPGKSVDVKDIVSSVIDTLTPLAAESGISIVKKFPEMSIAIPGSRDELFQVFENLLENACKYGQSGGEVIVSIERTDTGHGPEVTIAFRDFGPGISEEHIPRITERFYRVDIGTSPPQKGTGLGLAIVKHILTRHNGRLSIRSQVGEGAVFTAHLPAVAAGG
ncbi:two-component sensor histidine kinase [Mesorhizobium sp. NBSH29]|uniref:ATP-binding protein n=1 Tax=Mesorhizobium sp. NBSH29 TaxID=2654249 RepID=UPI00189644BC|nr:ATP-binding protein [Mesorhizobium sp. NBSH29]QPC86729.1 two-component sensor histidine kinase [Mesorhizobium sp. NBSH29]